MNFIKDEEEASMVDDETFSIVGEKVFDTILRKKNLEN